MTADPPSAPLTGRLLGIDQARQVLRLKEHDEHSISVSGRERRILPG